MRKFVEVWKFVEVRKLELGDFGLEHCNAAEANVAGFVYVCVTGCTITYGIFSAIFDKKYNNNTTKIPTV